MPDFPNMPGHRVTRIDGGLNRGVTDDAPLILLLGTASQGPGDDPYNARDTGKARKIFGSTSQLYQGLVECRRAYGEGANIHLVRIGTTPAVLQISGTNAESIKVIPRDRLSTIGDNYKVSFDGTANTLWVYNDLGSLVYCNAANNPVDNGEIEIRGDLTLLSGAPSFGDPTAGSLASSVSFSSSTASGTVFTAATTGPTTGDLRATYEALDTAYRILDAFDADIVVPLGVTADAPNVAYFISGVGGRDTNDVADHWVSRDNPKTWGVKTLGWLKVTAPTMTSADGSYTYDWADDVVATTDTNAWDTATDRIAADYHEVSFAHQLANFCYQQTRNQSTCIGVIGMEKPPSYYQGDIHRWIGKLPTKNAAGAITANGYGLCGFPETVGCMATRLNVLTHDKSSGRSPGFFATDSEFKDEAALVDKNGYSVDIGAYISLAADWPIHTNAIRGIQGYSASLAPYYAGLVAKLDEKDPPTNTIAPGLYTPYKAGKRRLDDLVVANMVMLTQRTDGSYVVDAPTAATDQSDFRNLSTVLLMGLAERVVRAIGQKYIGTVSNNLTREAFNSDIEEGLQNLVTRGYLKKFRFTITADPIQEVLGKLSVNLVLVVPTELRQIETTVSLSIE